MKNTGVSRGRCPGGGARQGLFPEASGEQDAEAGLFRTARRAGRAPGDARRGTKGKIRSRRPVKSGAFFADGPRGAATCGVAADGAAEA
jgi:hypothetical protein